MPDRVYTFTVTATNAVGTSVASSASLETKAANGIAPTLVVDPIPAPTGDLAENKVLSSNITFADFNSTPNSVVTYQWKRCTDPLDDTTFQVVMHHVRRFVMQRLQKLQQMRLQKLQQTS